MSPLEALLIAAYSLVVAGWIVLHLLLRVIERKTHVLGLRSPQLHVDDPPLVSVLVPAKDEQDTIETCLKSVLAQTYPNLEVIVIDDRSVDRTAHIVQSLAARDQRVRTLRITHLPPGWTGKAHALSEGAKLARGTFMLFTDADTRHAPESLAVTLHYAQQQRADCVSLLPRFLSESFWERLISPLAGSLLMSFYPLPWVNQSKHRRVAFANGQYLLIRRQVYEAIGGHSAVRGLAEDIDLARRVKGHGCRLKLGLGAELLSTRMYTGLRDLIGGWSRNLYAAVDGQPWKLLAASGFICLMSVSAYVVLGLCAALYPWEGHWAFPITVLGLNAIHLILMLCFVHRLYGFAGSDRRYLVLIHWLGLPFSLYILMLAVMLCLTRRVTWRGTVYRGIIPSSEPVPNVGAQSRPRR